jgi:hypothetical protein
MWCGPERLREIMMALFDRSAAVVERYCGTVDKFTGDGIMAVFGAPIALEDHALRACLAALDIQTQTAVLATDIQRRDGIMLQLRIGLNSGQVIAGEIGSRDASYTAVGQQVGIAQRMESAAPPGGTPRRAAIAPTSGCAVNIVGPVGDRQEPPGSPLPRDFTTVRAGMEIDELADDAARARVRDRFSDADDEDLLLLEDLLGPSSRRQTNRPARCGLRV